MNKKIFIVLSSVAALNIAACSTQIPDSADRYGTALGDISKLKTVYTLNSSRIDEVREVLGTPNYTARTQTGKNLYIYTYKVDYPFEGLSNIEILNRVGHNKNNALNDEIKAVATTSKIVAISTDDKGIATEDYFFGYKYIFSKTAKETNDSYCVTPLSEEEMIKKVNFSQYEIEAVADKTIEATNFIKLVKDKLESHFGKITEFNKDVKIYKEDGGLILSRPEITADTYCNKITCNKTR